MCSGLGQITIMYYSGIEFFIPMPVNEVVVFMNKFPSCKVFATIHN